MTSQATAGAGHNAAGVLTDEDRAALQHYHSRQIRAAQVTAEQKAAEAKAAKKVVNNRFKTMAGDLGYQRQEFEEVLDAEDLTEEEFQTREAARAKRFALHGLSVPEGTQLEINLGDTVDDLDRAEAAGRRAFNRSDSRIPGDEVSPVCHQRWLQGYDDEMTKSAQKMARAEAIIAARAAPEPEPEVEVEEPDEDFDADAAVRRVKNSDFMQRGPAEGAEVVEPALEDA